jgi:hypothetical protein
MAQALEGKQQEARIKKKKYVCKSYVGGKHATEVVTQPSSCWKHNKSELMMRSIHIVQADTTGSMNTRVVHSAKFCSQDSQQISTSWIQVSSQRLVHVQGRPCVRGFEQDQEFGRSFIIYLEEVWVAIKLPLYIAGVGCPARA